MDSFSWSAKLNLALVSEGVVTKQELQSLLPTPHQLADYGRTSIESDESGYNSCRVHQVSVAPHLLAALVCEKYDMDDEALAYIATIFDVDLVLGGDFKVTSHVLAFCLKGRVMARRGELQAAAGSFEEAVQLLEKHELWLLTAFALRDLKLCVLDEMGHGDHCAKRLGAVLRRLGGSASSLSKLLSGLDVAAMMTLPAPESGYKVVFAEVKLPALAALRTEDSVERELEGMRVTALQKRAENERVEQDKIDTAMDSNQPKAQLISLLLAQRKAGAPAAPAGGGEGVAAVRTELQSMRDRIAAARGERWS